MTQAKWKSKVVWLSIAAMVFGSAVGVTAAGAASGKENANGHTKSETKAHDSITVTDSVYGDDNSVTDHVYGNGNTQGLMNAIKNLQGKPSFEKVKALLLLRGVTAEEIALALEANGDVKSAIVAQETAVAEQPTDVKAVKKLAKLLKKAGKKGVLAFVNGKQPNFDVQPFMKDGRTLVLFRAIAASLKAEVTYDVATKTVTVVRGDITIKLTLGSDFAIVNGEQVKLDVSAQSVQGRTVIPLRFLSEELGAKVTFDQETQSIIVTK